MKLTEYTAKRQAFREAGIETPDFDREAMKEKTGQNPVWLHFGSGNIFRAFPAVLQQTLLEKGLTDRGVIAAESFDYEIIDKCYAPYDALGLLSVLKADGTVRHKVIASIAQALKADENTEDWKRLTEIFAAQSLQMVSFTITEKGYGDLSDGGLIDKLTRLLRVRCENGAYPLALVSMDNCSHNGEKLENAVMKRARQCCGEEEDFLRYLADRKLLSFPWTMIDKITPRPDEKVKALLEALGFTDTEITVTARHSYVAPFVNAEQAEYLVVEDDFPNGRPPLEEAGVYMTDRAHVNRVERMKVSTCLNPLHTALAIFGCLLGKKTIAEEMRDPDLKRMVYRLGYQEGMPVVTDPGILRPEQFIHDVLELRLPNPFMPDTPQRIATDTSQKLSVRFGETIKAYMKSEERSTDGLQVIPIVIAGWFRYLTGLDDAENPMTLSPDPLLDELRMEPGTALTKAEALMHREDIFGVDLYAAGLDRKILDALGNMLSGPGAVRRELARLS